MALEQAIPQQKPFCDVIVGSGNPESSQVEPRNIYLHSKKKNTSLVISELKDPDS